MDVYSQIVIKIIEQQVNVIGPIAVDQAKGVAGLKVDWAKKQATVSGNEQKVIDKLVEQYKDLFGKISVEVCKEAAGSMLAKLPADQIPTSLK